MKVILEELYMSDSGLVGMLEKVFPSYDSKKLLDEGCGRIEIKPYNSAVEARGWPSAVRPLKELVMSSKKKASIWKWL